MVGIKFLLVLFFTIPTSLVSCVVTGEIYSVDSLVAEPIGSLDVNGNSIILSEFNKINVGQRFIARKNNGYFNLFLESQPWNWVEYIVESSKTVNIKDKTPRALSVVNVNGVTEVVVRDYSGGNEQQWYIVPTVVDSEIGLITNLLHRLCISNNGTGKEVTLATCNLNDPNQIFQLTNRTQGRCY